MRLARTTTPLPRKSGWQESNLRSPAPKAGGVASSPTARRRTSTPGGIRTRSLRVEGPASSPARPRGQEAPAAGLEPASGDRRLRASNALPFQLGHASKEAEGEGVEPSRAEGPPVFETGYRAGGSPSESGPGRRRTSTIPGKNQESNLNLHVQSVVSCRLDDPGTCGRLAEGARRSVEERDVPHRAR
jgi:hypothetical protein